MNNETELMNGKTYIHSAACMSVTADALSWANFFKEKITNDPGDAENIVVLGCQVTDLAVLNDFKVLERLQSQYPGKRFFMGGCLGQRTDIDTGVERIDPLRHDYKFIENLGLVSVEPPFWVKSFKDDGQLNEKPGNLFRNHYPLRISVGCQGNCSFCTIKHTRAGAYDLSVPRLEQEMIWADNQGHSILLIADSPQFSQLIALIEYAYTHSIYLSLRNVEPAVMCELGSSELFSEFVYAKLLDYCHVPLQSMSEQVLKDMKRSVSKTEKAFDILCNIRKEGVRIATNVIVDYKGMQDPSLEIFNEHFDYVSWNPLWTGPWDRKEAEKRFEHYSDQF